MTVHIIDDTPDVYLTRADYERLMQEYQKAYTHYAGPVPSFESWVRQRQGSQINGGADRG